jgi:hypothetical protein
VPVALDRHLEMAIAEYLDRFNHRRLHGEICLGPPIEFEQTYYRHNPATTPVTTRQLRVSTKPGARQTSAEALN